MRTGLRIVAVFGVVSAFAFAVAGIVAVQEGGVSRDASHMVGGLPVSVSRLCLGSSPVCSPDGQLVAFVDSVYDNSGRLVSVSIKAIATAGTPRERELGQFAGESDLYWLPDSRHIVYGERGELLALPVDSGQPRVIGHYGGTLPSLSPDGRHVATVEGAAGTPNVWITRVDGTHSRPITEYGAFSSMVYRRARVAWSRDGQWLAYAVCPKPLRRAKWTTQLAVCGTASSLNPGSEL